MTNIIPINAPYVKYQSSGAEHTFTVSMSKLMDEFIEHELDPAVEKLFFKLRNPNTGNDVNVYLDSQQSHLSRLYLNNNDNNRIIKLVVT